MAYGSVAEVLEDLRTNPVEEGGHIYHPIPFPEFSDLVTSSDSEEARRKWSLVRQVLDDLYPAGIRGLQVLDIGANAGFHTFSLAQEGVQVTAFEPHPRYGRIGKFLASEKNLDVSWHSEGFDRLIVASQSFDVTLMLSVFQWMADGGHRMVEATKDLHFISTISRYLVFELGFNRGKSCIRTGKLNHYAELVRMLARNTEYRQFKLLGTTQLWHSVSRYLVLCSNDARFEDSMFNRVRRTIRL